MYFEEGMIGGWLGLFGQLHNHLELLVCQLDFD